MLCRLKGVLLLNGQTLPQTYTGYTCHKFKVGRIKNKLWLHSHVIYECLNFWYDLYLNTIYSLIFTIL